MNSVRDQWTKNKVLVKLAIQSSPRQDGPLIPELSFGFYSDRTDIFTNDQTVIEKTKQRFLVQDGYPQNLITEYNISNKLLHFNETHKIRDPKHLREGLSFREGIIYTV